MSTDNTQCNAVAVTAPPVPETIRAIDDVSLRQRAVEAWRSASSLCCAMQCWSRWATQLALTDDADSGVAVELDEVVWASVNALCRLRVTLAPFDQAQPGALMEEFPRQPSGLLDPPWQQDQNYREDLQRKVITPGWYAMQGVLRGFMRRLETAPSTCFHRPGDMAQPAGGSDRRAGHPATPDREARRRSKKRGRPVDTDPVRDQRIADAWATGRYRKHEDLASEFSITELDVKQTLDRVRKRKSTSKSGGINRRNNPCQV